MVVVVVVVVVMVVMVVVVVVVLLLVLIVVVVFGGNLFSHRCERENIRQKSRVDVVHGVVPGSVQNQKVSILATKITLRHKFLTQHLFFMGFMVVYLVFWIICQFCILRPIWKIVCLLIEKRVIVADIQQFP